MKTFSKENIKKYALSYLNRYASSRKNLELILLRKVKKLGVIKKDYESYIKIILKELEDKKIINDESLANSIEQVSTIEAMSMARQLSETESIFAGPSSGANLAAAFNIAAKMPEDSIVVTIFPDTGFKYLSTPLYNLTTEET